MTSAPDGKPASTELTGGAGFTYEDTVGAYYLAHLLRREGAAGQAGVVVSVAVQQQGHGNPMDDLVVEFDEGGTKRVLGLQIKRSVTISGADADFRAIVTAAVKTQALATFTKSADKCGFVVEHVTDATLRTLKRLIDWAGDSPTGAEFEARFAPAGAAARAERELRDALSPSSVQRTSMRKSASTNISLPSTSTASKKAACFAWTSSTACKNWSRATKTGRASCCSIGSAALRAKARAKERNGHGRSLVAQLRGAVRLKISPHLGNDINRLNAYSLEALNVVSEKVDDFHVERTELQSKVAQATRPPPNRNYRRPSGMREVGYPEGLCASWRRLNGPILFLKNDRITGTGWTQFAAGLGLSVTDPVQLLVEIGSTGTPVLFIDGIDRIRPDQQGVIIDLVNAIHGNPDLSHWKVLVTSRDQGLEAFRAWFPPSMYGETGIGDVIVPPFSDEEAEQLAQSKPQLRKLLFGSPAVQRHRASPVLCGGPGPFDSRRHGAANRSGFDQCVVETGRP